MASRAENGNAWRSGHIDTVSCLQHPGQTYCLLRPSSNPDNAPLVVFLEPGGRGSLPLRLYRDLAEKYGYMLACSNNGRNGPLKYFIDALDAMIPDIAARFHPDTNRMAFCGFSGGGRCALLYSHSKRKTGVIACGSGISPGAGVEQLRLPFYIGIAGRKDMNYLELTDAVEKAGQLGTPAWMIAFDGGHSWPDTLALRRAFDQVEIQWHERGYVQLSGKARKRIRVDICCQLDSMLNQGRFHEANSLRSGFVDSPVFDPLDPCWLEVSSRFPSAREMEKAERSWEKIRKKEKRYQDSIVAAIYGIDLAGYKQMGRLRPDSWWRSQGKKVRKAMGSKSFLVRESAERMHDFVRGNCQEEGYFSLDDPGGPEQAARYFRAWCSFDPVSPDAWYWLAIAYTLGDQQQDAIEALETAVSNGLKSERIEATGVFESLRSHPGYRSLIGNPGK